MEQLIDTARKPFALIAARKTQAKITSIISGMSDVMPVPSSPIIVHCQARHTSRYAVWSRMWNNRFWYSLCVLEVFVGG